MIQAIQCYSYICLIQSSEFTLAFSSGETNLEYCVIAERLYTIVIRLLLSLCLCRNTIFCNVKEFEARKYKNMQFVHEMGAMLYDYFV